MPYTSPTVGLFFFTEDYLKFLGNLEHYLNEEIQFISHDQSKYKDILKERNTPPCPIGVLDDIEIVFLHYHSEEEARTKWNRRKERMNLSKVIVKMTEQNLCDPSQLMQFDSLSYKNKFVFVHKDYGLNSQIVCKEFENCSEVTNDTDHFRRYIDLVALIRNLS